MKHQTCDNLVIANNNNNILKKYSGHCCLCLWKQQDEFTTLSRHDNTHDSNIILLESKNRHNMKNNEKNTYRRIFVGIQMMKNQILCLDLFCKPCMFYFFYYYSAVASVLDCLRFVFLVYTTENKTRYVSLCILIIWWWK